MTITIDFSGATYSLFSNFISDFIIEGTGTLTGNYAISTSITPVEGKKFIFYYKGLVDKATFTFNILGTNLTEEQLNRDSTIEAVYNGVSWDINIYPNTRATNWIVPDDLMSGGDLEVINIPISFDAGEVYEVEIPMPYSCNVNIFFFRVTKAIAATDAATIELYDNVTQMGTTMTIPLSTVQGTGFQIPVNYDYVSAGIYSTIKIVPAKVTPGGQGILSIIVARA